MTISEITPGQEVLVLAEANAVEPQMVTVTPSGYRFTGRPWRAYVDPKCCVPLDDLREVLRRCRENAECNPDESRACSMMECDHEALRSDLAALLAQLGGQG